MVSLQEVEQRLTGAGLRMRHRGRPEVRELCHILLPDEVVAKAVHGHYENGAALLVATDRRLLLVDKKPLFLNLEDVAYHMISDIHFDARLLNSTVFIRATTRHLRFTARHASHLRELTSLVQQHLTEIRHFSAGRNHQPMNLAFDPTLQTYVMAPDTTLRDNRTSLVSRRTAISTANASFRRRVSRFYPTSL